MSLVSAQKITKIVKAIQKIYPVGYADNTWDNTGLLVDNSVEDLPETPNAVHILLTVDLTQSVAEEALKLKSGMILAYHPFIFRGLKSISPSDPQQKSLLKLIRSGVSVYCPHTAIDAAIGGVNDWLVETITDGGDNLSSKTVIEPNPDVANVGMGRLINLKHPIKLEEAIRLVKTNLKLPYIQVATKSLDKSVKTIAICAGSGAGVFKGVKADLYYTGEMSHHEALYYKECGSAVIACNHSNTERGFLPVLKQQLLKQFATDGVKAEIDISKTDRDPYEVV